MKKEPSYGGTGTSGLIDAKRSSHGLTIKFWQPIKGLQYLALKSGRSADWSAVSNGLSSGTQWSGIDSGFWTNMEDRQVSGKSWCLHTTMSVPGSVKGLRVCAD